jgi:hypothetical protein
VRTVKFATTIVSIPVLLLTAAVALRCRAVTVNHASDLESFLPRAYDPTFAYPVVVLLPPLGATAADVFDGFLAEDRAHTSKQASFENWLSRMPLNNGDDLAHRGSYSSCSEGKGRWITDSTRPFRHQQPPGMEFLRGVRFVLAPDSK